MSKQCGHLDMERQKRKPKAKKKSFKKTITGRKNPMFMKPKSSKGI